MAPQHRANLIIAYTQYVIAFIAHRQYANCSPPLLQNEPESEVEQSMKNLKYVSNSSQSVAKLIAFVLLMTGNILAADTSPFASIVGVWPTHFGNGISRVYRINENGTITYEQQEPAETKSSKLTVINGGPVADFGDRLMAFYRVSDDQMNVAIFGSKEKLDEHKPNVTGKGYRAIPSNASDPILGTWKWLLNERRDPNGVVEIKADGTFTMIGTSKIGVWKLASDRSYVLNWFTIGAENKMKLSTNGNDLAGSGNGILVFGERMQGATANTTPAPQVARVPTRVVVPTTPVPAAPTAPISVQKDISLKVGWDGPMQGGSKTLEDVAFVLNGFAKADPNPPFEDVEIYNGVKYLMPLNEAVAALGIKGRLPAMKKVVCPGFPRESLNYTSFDGIFEGHYNRMDIVTDVVDQVVTIQFVDEHPKDASFVPFALKGDWLTYNFVGYRVKAMTTLNVQYSLEAYETKQSRWWRETPEYLARYYPTSPALRVFTYLMDKHQLKKPDRRLEETLWCVPRPFASLILHCVTIGRQ